MRANEVCGRMKCACSFRGNSIANLQDNCDNGSTFNVLCTFLVNLVVRFSA